MTQAALRSRSGDADQDAWLARAAAAGHGRAFATLYARYEDRVYNLAFRITGSRSLAAPATREAFLDSLRALPHATGTEARFDACLFTATRNASYDLVEPLSAEGPPSVPAHADPPEREEEPDGAPGFDEDQDPIGEAGLRLATPDREVLALAASGDLSYGEIAPILDTDPGSVPVLTALAWMRLQAELSGTAPAAEPSGECWQALPLIAMRDDGQLDDEEDFGWLLDHLAHCGPCRRRLDAMEAARAAYDTWEPVVAPPTLFGEVMAAAARATDTDWTELIDELSSERSGRRAAGVFEWARAGWGGKWPPAGLGEAVATAGGAAGTAVDSLRAGGSKLVSGAWRHRPRGNRVVTVGLVLLILLGLSGIGAGATLVLRGSDRPTEPAGRDADPAFQKPPAVVQRPERRPRAAITPRTKRVRAPRREVTPVSPRPVTEPPDAEAESRRRAARRPQRRRAPRVEAVPLKPKPPASDPAPTQPPAGTPGQPPVATPPQPPAAGCKDATGKPVPCPG